MANLEVSLSKNSLKLYACPTCKGKLEEQDAALWCDRCHRDHPIKNDIPDFLMTEESVNPLLRQWARLAAPIYETNLYVSAVLNGAAGWRVISATEIIDYVQQKVSPIKGPLLDIATGPATLGRRVASTSRVVYGIDVSLDMLRMGQKHVERENINGMNLARANVQALPFGNNLFEGCIASGCLHLFPDTVEALKEISRTLKPGALFVGLTFVSGKAGLIKYKWVRDHVQRKNLLIIFEQSVFQEYLKKAGFEAFEPDRRGSALLFTARKAI